MGAQRLQQTETFSNSSLLQLNNTVFESCSTGSLLGGLKPFVPYEDNPTDHPSSDQARNSAAVTAAMTCEVAALSSNDQSACLSAAATGLRHVLKERREAKKTNYLVRTPPKQRKRVP